MKILAGLVILVMFAATMVATSIVVGWIATKLKIFKDEPEDLSDYGMNGIMVIAVILSIVLAITLAYAIGQVIFT